nr:hypothetical protein [Intestinirhabdus alba]
MVAFRYDERGRLAEGEEHQARRWHYDAAGRLTAAESPSSYSEGHVQKTEAFDYDPFNRRTSKCRNGELTEFIWQGNRLVAQTRGSGRVLFTSRAAAGAGGGA